MAQKLMPRLDFPAGQRGGPSRRSSTRTRSSSPAAASRSRPIRRATARRVLSPCSPSRSAASRGSPSTTSPSTATRRIRFGDTAVACPSRRRRPRAARRRRRGVARTGPRPVGGCSRATRRRAQSASWCSAVASNASASTATRLGAPRCCTSLARFPAAIVADMLGVHVTTAAHGRRSPADLGRLPADAQPIHPLSAPRPAVDEGSPPRDGAENSCHKLSAHAKEQAWTTVRLTMRCC